MSSCLAGSSKTRSKTKTGKQTILTYTSRKRNNNDRSVRRLTDWLTDDGIGGKKTLCLGKCIIRRIEGKKHHTLFNINDFFFCYSSSLTHKSRWDIILKQEKSPRKKRTPKINITTGQQIKLSWKHNRKAKQAIQNKCSSLSKNKNNSKPASSNRQQFTFFQTFFVVYFK